MTKKNQLNFLNTSLLVLFGISCCNAQFIVDVIKMAPFGEEELVHKCVATGGNFGRDVSDFIMTEENLGCGVSVAPSDACSPITAVQNHTKSCYNLFALVSRSSHAHPCKFSHQAFMVQNSSSKFQLVMFYNYPDQDPISMDGADMRDQINIPVLMISDNCRNEILRKFPESSGYRLRIRIDPGYYELFRYLIPFLVVIVFCFALFLITLCVRGCVERRKLNKRRLSKRNLKKIPVKKYRLGDDPDTCAICLESFAQGEKLRHLPCRHVFHCKCIDVWLTQTRKVCPLCKRKIGSDSDSECSTSDLQNTVHDLLSVNRNNTLERPQSVQNNARLGEIWSSQEALVDEDIVLAGNSRRTFTEYVRHLLRRLRNNQRTQEENNVDLENNLFLARQTTENTDTDGLLGNEMAQASQNSDSQLSTTTEETTITLSESTTNQPNTSAAHDPQC